VLGGAALSTRRLQVAVDVAEEARMRRRDSTHLPVRALYLAVRGEFRVRQTLRSLRQAGGWTIAGVVRLVLGLAFRSWVLFGAFGAVLLLTAAGWLVERRYVSRARLEDIDEMTGWEFERWPARFFECVGFGVRRTPYRGDFGADFVLSWNGVKIAVQAKRSRRQVGVSAVQEVVAAKAYYGCEQAMVVTNGYFTEQAIILARANGVRMRSRDDLVRELAVLGEDGQSVQARRPQPTEFAAF
jgi:restriction system protein